MSFNQKETPKVIWKQYDPDKAREGLRKSAGALKGVDTEALKRDIRDQRKQDSHGRPASYEYSRRVTISVGICASML